MEPAGSVRLAGEAESVKLCADCVATSTSTVVLADTFPELPLMAISYFPGAAAELAVSVSELVVLVVAGLKAALKPAGRPEAERLTLPVKPFDAATLMVLVVLVPGTKEMLPADAMRFRVGDPASRVTTPQPANSTTTGPSNPNLGSPNQLSPARRVTNLLMLLGHIVFVPHPGIEEIPFQVVQ